MKFEPLFKNKKDVFSTFSTTIDMELKDALALIGLLIGTITLLKGVYEYQEAQKWKKLEFIAKEVKELLNDFDVKRMFILLDWNSITLPLKEGEIEGVTGKILITDDIIFSGLQFHEKKPTFKLEEVLVRYIFDAGLTRLGLFNQYVKTGLMTSKDLKPYVIYWIKLLGTKENGRKSGHIITQIWEFIEKYEYTDVQELCKEYGYDIKNKNKEVEQKG